MTERDQLTEEFERQRPRMRAVAYRMLGSRTEAEDAVQEAWLRLNRSDSTAIENLGGWLTTVVARVSLDMLRSRQSRRENLVGSWLPEPIVTLVDEHTPEQEAILADSVGLALLVVLDSLAPAERVAFVLHDMFAMPFDDIARILDRTPAATRQLASRARRQVRGVEPDPDTDTAAQRQLVNAFLAAARDGDFAALVAVLDPQVVFRVDRGGDPARALEPVVGSEQVAENVVTNRYRVFADAARPAIVNGTAGLLIVPGDRPIAVIGFAMRGGRISEIDVIADPAKLRGVPR
jgi:RNA polymerase sigma-70 factor (ECF subfamily)